MITRLFTLILIGFSTTFLFSQTDYVVTTKGDTIRGKITFQQSTKVEQVIVKAKKRQSISSMQVRMVFLRGKSFRPVQFGGKVQMMQVLTDGYLSLLAFQPNGVMSYDGRLLTLRDGNMLEVPTIGFKNKMADFLKEDEELSAQIKDKDFDRKDLDKIIEQFNSRIEKRTVQKKEQLVNQGIQKTKIEMLEEIITDVKNSSIEDKEEVTEMLNDVKNKINDNKSIPQYLSNSIREKTNSNAEISKKIENLLNDLNSN